MDDKKRVLIFTDEGRHRVLLQSDLDAKNQRRRVHYLVQPGWRADKAVQGLGRTHRSNQANQPLYVLPTTNLKAQKRFISSIARRLDQLGALTKGQRNTNSQGLFTNRDNLESTYATAAVRALFRDMVPIGGATVGTSEPLQLEGRRLIHAMGLDRILDAQTGALRDGEIPTTTRFLNRLLNLEIKDQNFLFEEFENRMDAAIDAAIEAGTFDDGMQTVKALRVAKLRDEAVYTDPRTQATTRYVELELTHNTVLNTWDQVQESLHNHPGKSVGYYYDHQTKQPFVAVDMGVRVGADGQLQHRGYRYDVKATNGTQRGRWITNRDQYEGLGRPKDRQVAVLEQPIGDTDKTIKERVTRYKKLGADEATYLWGDALAEAPKTYTTPLHMLVGVLLPVWDRIKTDGGSAAVVRTQTDKGERLIGRVSPSASARISPPTPSWLDPCPMVLHL
jgi:hypothetical protein